MKKNTEQFGKYMLFEKLASGGMAEIFLARAPGAGGIRKFIAIKRILPQFSDNIEYKDMFTSEAKIAVNLSHGNVVSIYEFGIEDKQLFLVMDYVEGRNLRQILNKMREKSKRLSIDQIVYIVKEVAAGLDHAHRCLDGTTGEPLQIIHRDMSPQNIMISFEGEVKIVDFGIAKLGSESDGTPDGTLKGKFGYMSPEQAEGQTVDLKTDIFSLGIILWELIANERLFLANNEINTLRKIRRCQVPSLRRINPNISPDLERIVRKTLAKDKNLRYQHSAALHRDLNRFLNKRFPDFSPHDFSASIKGLYTDEILKTRKRLVEYAKIPFENDLEDKTLFINPASDQLLETMIMERGAAGSTVTLTDAERLGLQTQTSSQAELGKDFDPHDEPSYSSSPQIGINTQTGTNRSLSLRTTTDIRLMRKEPTSRFIAILLTILALGSLTYFTNMHKKILPSSVLKIIPNSGEQEGSSTTSSTLTNPTPPNPNVQSSPNQQETKNINNVPISISSDPSGANIFINGKNTGKSTPSRILVPYNTPINVQLKKENYITYTKENVVANRTGITFQSKLQRAAIGYLDIDTTPPSPAVKIYLDGKLLRGEQLPIRKYAVPAKKIIIEAKDPIANTYAKKRILLQQGQRRSIILKLKSHKQRYRRTPSRQK